MLITSLCLATISFAQKFEQGFAATDIDNFWAAHDKIVSEKDSIKQYRLLNELYLSKATPGLKSIIEVRNYKEKEFIDMITNYPKFWNSIKPNTLKIKDQYSKINSDIKKLKKAYPGLNPRKSRKIF